MSSSDNEWSRPAAPPPPLFIGDKEKDLAKNVADEINERIIGQTVIYYPISIEHTNFHPVYGEAIEKSFLSPIRVHALVEWSGNKTRSGKFGVDRRSEISIKFHKRRLTEDQDLYVRIGDYVLYGDIHYEIVELEEPKRMYGQIDNRYEITAKCITAREGKFNAR